MPDSVVTVRMQAVDETGPGTASAEGHFKKVDQAAGHAAASTKQIGTAATEAASTASGPLSKLSGTLGEIGKMAAGFAVGGIATQLGMGLAEQIKGSIDQAKEFTGAVKSLQMITGDTPERLSGVVAAFERFGVSTQQASTSLGIFSRQITKTPIDLEELGSGLDANGKPLKGFADVMHDLGVNTEDSTGKTRPMMDVLMQTADKFKELGKGTEATADAMVMFGRSGKAMLPLLMQGSEGIKEAADTAAKFGMQLTTENMAQVKDFGFANKDLGEAMNGLKLQLGLALMPALAALAHIGATVAQTFNQLLMPVIKLLGTAISDLVGWVKNALAVMPAWLSPLAAIYQAFTFVTDNIDNFHDAWNALVEALTGDAGAMGVVYDMIRKVFGDTVAEDLQPFLQWFMTSIPLIKDAWNAVIEAFSGTPGALGIVEDVIRKVFGDDAANAVDPFLQKLMAFIPTLQEVGGWLSTAFADLSRGDIRNALIDMSLAFQTLTDIDTTGFAQAVGKVADAFNNLLQPVKDLWSQFASDPMGTLSTGFDDLQQAMQPFLPSLDMMRDGFAHLLDLWNQLWPHPITDIGQDILALGQTILDVAGHVDWLSVALDALKVVAGLVLVVVTVLSAIFDALATAIDGVTKFVKEHQAAQAAIVGVLAAVTAGLIAMGIQWAINTALMIAQAAPMALWLAQMMIAQFATDAWAAAQAALNIVLALNPIGIIVIALIGLAAALVWAYNNIQPFHDAVNNVWAAMRGWFDWFSTELMSELGVLGEKFSELGTFISDNGDTIKTVLLALLGPIGLVADAWINDWGGVREHVQDFVDWVQTIPATIQTAMDAIGQAFSTLGQKIHDALANIKIDIGPFHWDANGFHKDDISMPSLPGFGGGGGGGGTTDDTGGGAATQLAFQTGGWLKEPIMGVGPSGTRYQLHANEFVSPPGPLATAAAAAHGGGMGAGGITLNVAAGAVQISGANGPAADWAAAADGLWDDLYAKLSRALDNRVSGVGAT